MPGYFAERPLKRSHAAEEDQHASANIHSFFDILTRYPIKRSKWRAKPE